VRSTDDARRAVDAGAQFIVSPGASVDVIEICQALAVPVLPGACTPTEVETVVRAGAEVVKFFPAEPVGGLAFLKALIAPFRNVRFIPTGGINPGSWMATSALLREGDFARVEQLARESVELVARIGRA
jgi:2-dehydro-3-deoxyphosphogluconate aldolase/(4S)-4-hydroxy-2-oxoglutarate aldolase